MAESTDKDLRSRFWELPLAELNPLEWERLCDHCGRCCLKKLEDEDDGELYWTRIICRYHDSEKGACGCYAERNQKVPECMNVADMGMETLHWMPDTCAYRLRMEDRPLYDWHPLLSGSRQAMEEAGITIKDKVIAEDHVHPLGYDEHIIRWVKS